MQPLIDVLIPNYLTADLVVAGIITPLKKHLAHGINLIVVDDGSPDDDTDLLLPHAGLIWKYQHHEHNLGPAATFNHLLDLSQAPFIFLCNSDVIIPNFQELTKLSAALERLPAPAILGTTEGPRFFDTTGRPYTLPPKKGGETPCHQDYTSACAMMLRKQDLTSQMRFSTSFLNGYYEDSDLCYRLRSAGWETYYVTSSIGHLNHQAMIRRETMQRHPSERLGMFEAIERNRVIFMDTWAAFMRPKTDDIDVAHANYHDVQKQLQENRDQCSRP